MLPEFVDGAKYMEVMNVASQFSSGKDMYTQAAINATRNGTDPDLYPNVKLAKGSDKGLCAERTCFIGHQRR